MTGFQLTDRVNRSAELVPRPCGPPSFFEFFAAAQLALADVGAARKRAALAVEDRDLGLGIEVEAVQRLVELRTTSSLTALSLSGRFSVIVAIRSAHS